MGFTFCISTANPLASSRYQNTGDRKNNAVVRIPQNGIMSFTYTEITDNRYDNPRIKTIRSTKIIGRNTTVQAGIKENTGIKTNKIAISMKSVNADVVVETTGKNSLLMFIEEIIPMFALRLIMPRCVPLAKAW